MECMISRVEHFAHHEQRKSGEETVEKRDIFYSTPVSLGYVLE